MEGHIFDIQRFVLHDGPGIRTAVFIKGCPLICKWCCNPESQEQMPQLAYNSNKCVDSLECVSDCTYSAHSSLFGYHRFDRDKCTNCGDCADSCTNNALTFYGYKASVDDVIETILKDLDYYKNSGGGLTLSGGDPLQQISFSTEILKRAKEAGIHTCVETAGYADPEKIEAIAPYINKVHPVYPPGQQSLESFLHKCTGCMLCAEACPTDIINMKAGTAGTSAILPVLNFESNYCTEGCIECTKACPTGALNELLPKEKDNYKMATLELDLDKCLILSDGVECGLCVEICPYEAMKMEASPENKDVKIPVVIQDQCTGCGKCQYRCPVKESDEIFNFNCGTA